MASESGTRTGLSVTLSVRPPRVGVLVPRVKGVSWQRLFELAVASQARMWGGSGNLVLPLTPDFTERDLFWELADRFDADSWAVYAVTYGDMETLDPVWHEANTKRLTKQLEDFGAEARDDFLERHRSEQALEVQPTEEQQELLTRRLAPLHHNGADNGSLDSLTAFWEPRWPWVDVAAFDALPTPVENVTTRASQTLSLLLTTELGRLTEPFGKALDQQDIPVLDDVRPGTTALQLLLGGNRSSRTVYPWTLSELGLAWYGAGRLRSDRVTVVVGDSPWDFALFYALRRWTSLAFWYPTALQRTRLGPYLLLNAVERSARTTRPPVAVVTASDDLARRDQVVRDLNGQTGRPLRAEASNWLDALPDEPNRLLEGGNPGLAEHIPLVGGVTSPLPTPTPRTVRCRDDGEMRWMTDVLVDGWAPVRNRKLGPAVVQQHGYGTELVRTTRTGAAYFCPHFFWQGGMTLEAVTVRPRLRPMSLRDQISFLLADIGWETEFSDKGVYAEETTRLLGGRAALVRALQTADVAKLLNAFRKGNSGIKLGDRRYLSLRHMNEELFDNYEARTRFALHELMTAGAMLRGLVLACERCRHTSWYPLDEVGSRFRCTRCRHDQEADRLTGAKKSWRGDTEPVWFYCPDEVVQQFLRNNGDLPFLAVEDSFSGDARPVDRTFELSLREKDGPGDFEIDLAVSDGYRLWLGEASITGSFEPEGRLDNLRWLADELGAYGVLLATRKASFPAATLEAIATSFSSSRAHVKRLTHAGRSGP